MISRNDLKELLRSSVLQREQLGNTYLLLPKTKCHRRTDCCAMLPEMTLLEALDAVHRLTGLPPVLRMRVLRNIVRYFLINPVEITSCPFLENQDCLVYENRFFGCRAYGLWSPEYYGKIAERSRQAKSSIQKQWRDLGVSLPQNVISYNMPYCSNVKRADHRELNDNTLLGAAIVIENLSQRFLSWHELFHGKYFSDLSFFITSLIFGVTGSVQMKFTVVRDIVNNGNRQLLNKIIAEVMDPLGKLP